MAGGKKTPGKDNKAQSSSEHKGQEKGVKGLLPKPHKLIMPPALPA